MWKAFMYDLPLPERKTDINEYRWILESELLTVKGEELLVVNCYFKNNKELNYRVFISKSQYITLDCTTQKPSWKTGKIDNYAKTEWWRSDVKGVYIEKEYSDIIINYIGGSAKDGYDAVCKFQSNMLAQRILRAEKRITDPIDVKMEQVGNLPEDFKQWLIEDVFIESRYIYYQYEKKVNLKGYCTYCEREAMVYKPIHNQVGTCPCCGSSIIYKSIGKSKHIEDIRFVSIMQKTDDGFLIRHFKIKKKYYGSEWRYKKPETNVWEEERTFYDNDINTDNYDFSMFKNKYTRWNKRDSGMVSHESHVYPHNVYECIRDSKIRFCELQTLAGNKVDFEFCVERFIRKYKEGNVYLEHLIKAGLFSLVKDLVEYYGEKDEINHKGKTLNAVLGIENDDIRILREANITYDVLQLFKIQRKLGRRLTVEQLKKIDVNYNSEKVNQIFSYAPVTKALKYLGTQPKYVSDPETLYLDYLDSCKKLGQDLKNSFVLFPKDLRAAHDVNVEIINEKANRRRPECITVNMQQSEN